MVLTCFSLIANYVEHLFMCLLSICISLTNVYLDPLPFKNYLLFLSFTSSLYILNVRVLPAM